MSFDDLNLRVKNLIPLAAMVLATLAVLGFGALTLSRVSGYASDIIERRDVATAKIIRATRLIYSVPADLNARILSSPAAEMAKASEHEFKSAPDEAMSLLDEGVVKMPEHAEELRTFRTRFAEIYEIAKPLFQQASSTPGLDQGRALKSDELEDMSTLTRNSALIYVMTNTLIQDMWKFNNSLMRENADIATGLRERSREAVTMLAVAGVLGAALSVAFSLWVTAFKVERPLNRLGATMRALASGDLDVAIDGDRRGDEIGEMARAVAVFKTNAVERQRSESDAAALRLAAEDERAAGSTERARLAQAQTAAMSALGAGLRHLADGNLTSRLKDGFSGEFLNVRDDFNAAADKLKAALGLVVRSTGSIQTSSKDISTASANLSERTEQQAASLEETAAALGQITKTLRASADNAQHAASVVAHADVDAKQGAVVVRQAVEAMDAIATSSQQIGQIIGAIDEIAFQTNLLALNAGVEAARAGDSGRGFAVVAMEVRALAQRSAEAAKEIKALVSTSGSQVSAGVRLVGETGKSLESIIKQVSEINMVVAEIAEATRQQATGVAEINVAIIKMDETTQQNATMVEESTAASHALSRATSELMRLVEQFRLADASDDELRRNLKSVAPHVFAKPPAKPGVAPTRTRAKAAVQLARASSGGDWTEF